MKKGVKLIVKDKTIIPSGLSYINNEGKHVKYDGKYKISGNSYTFTYIDKKQIKLLEELLEKKMNEIDEFMSKFREDVETKWGLATDSSLGNKVKITLLATGFGLGDISRDRIEPTSITSRKTQAEMEDEKSRYEERMRKFYGKDKDSNNIRRNHHVFIFSEENIDNEDVISMVENLPTYNRTKEGLKSITTKSAGLETVETEEDNINFNLKG